MGKIWLLMIILIMSIPIVLIIGCSKTEDEEKQPSNSVALSANPAEHEVVSNVLEFFKAIDAGDYDRAIELGTPNKFKWQELHMIHGGYDLKNVEIAGAYVGVKDSVVLASPVFTIGQSKDRVHLGFSLVKSRKRRLIRQMHIHSFLNDAQDWLADFKDIEPTAESVTGSD